MYITTAGNVGIGTGSPGYKLHVNGSAGKPGGGSWSNASDIRLKDVDGAYSKGLNEIAALDPIMFHYKDDNARDLPSDAQEYGFVAQDVQTVFPEAVSQGEDGYLDFNMHAINVAMVNAIKELKAENQALRQDIAGLKAHTNYNTAENNMSWLMLLLGLVCGGGIAASAFAAGVAAHERIDKTL